MPSLEDIVKNRQNKKFIKKAFRPWDLSGKGVEKLKEERQQSDQDEITIVPTINNNLNINLDNSSEEVIIESPEIITQELSKLSAIKNVTYSAHNIVSDSSDRKESYITAGDNILNFNNVDLNIKIKILNLYGLQKLIFFVLLSNCIDKERFTTSDFAIKDLQAVTNASTESVKTSLLRLIKKGLIVRHNGKRAKGGYLNLGFEKNVWSIALVLAKENGFILNDKTRQIEEVN
jgi:predicted transcriptional regulator